MGALMRNRSLSLGLLKRRPSPTTQQAAMPEPAYMISEFAGLGLRAH